MKSRDNLYLVQDGDVPLYVLASNYGEAVQRWEAQIRVQCEIPNAEDVDPPHGVQLVAKAGELVLPPAFDLVAHLHRQSDWSRRTFGPGTRTVGIADHIEKELREVREAAATAANAELSGSLDRSHRDDLLAEWIDVAILAFDGAWRTGALPEQIVEALAAKQVKNEARTWPDWRSADPNKAIEHDRTVTGGAS